MTVGDFELDAENMDLDLNDKVTDLAGIYDLYWQVHSHSLVETATNVQTELDRFAVCNINKSLSCCSHEYDCENMIEWMLDSGASFHFTGDINDFVEYLLWLPRLLHFQTSNPFFHG